MRVPLYSSLAAVRLGTGLEGAGRSGDRLFVSLVSGDYRLQATSPAIDGGLWLPGINDRYSAAAPDIGALEVASTTDTTPPAQILDLR